MYNKIWLKNVIFFSAFQWLRACLWKQAFNTAAQPLKSVFVAKTGKSLNKKDELRSIKNASLNKNCGALSSGWLFLSLTRKTGRRKLRRIRKEPLFLVVMEGACWAATLLQHRRQQLCLCPCCCSAANICMWFVSILVVVESQSANL